MAVDDEAQQGEAGGDGDGGEGNDSDDAEGAKKPKAKKKAAPKKPKAAATPKPAAAAAAGASISKETDLAKMLDSLDKAAEEDEEESEVE